MFDVLWTDPDRELVGERRQRKQKEKEEKEKEKVQAEGQEEKADRHNSRGSESLSQRFLGSRTLGKAVAPLKSQPSSKPSPLLTQSTTQGSTKRDSDASQPLSDTLGDSQKLPERVPACHSRNEHISFPSSRDSAGSKWTDRTVPTNLSSSGASITESARASGSQTRGQSLLFPQARDITARSWAPEVDVFPPTRDMSAQTGDSRDGELGQHRTSEAEGSDDGVDVPVDTFPGPMSSQLSIPPGWASAFKANNPNAWKTPAEWARAAQEARCGGSAAGPSNASTKKEDGIGSRAAELRQLSQEVKMMAKADPATILRHLVKPMPDMSGSIQYKELENERKKWMLSVLYSLDGAVKMNDMPRQPDEKRPRNVLALLESPSTASYLANVHSHEYVYHMSPSPLSKEQFPNIQPLVVPGQASNIPVSGRIFSTAYSLSLPSVAAKIDIPDILRELNRCLLPGATFHLVLIDAIPEGRAMGPCLRNWLNEHLMRNLSRKGRASTPTAEFPDWLSENHLRGVRSTILKAKFLAVDAEEKPIDSPGEVRKETRAVVGRMLWKEVWGAHVEADKWWWEEDYIVKECRQLRTYWEYSLIEAVNAVYD